MWVDYNGNEAEKMTAKDFSMVELTGPGDDLLLPWLDLYETAFAPCEKVLVSEHLKILREKAQGEARYHHLLAVLDGRGAFAGMVRYQLLPEAGAAFLWYLAVEPHLRSTGLGSKVYRELLQRVDNGVIKALVFEVEIPELQDHEDGRQLARRRIEFYRRQGARLLRGIDYLQYVGSHQVPTPMHLMVHPLQELTAAQAFALAKAVYQDALTQVGEIGLE
jgi:GNAT superfamily N-acetyltransferase